MQCACSRNSTLFKVVPLLELKTRGDAGHIMRSSRYHPAMLTRVDQALCS
jgi:hypothetical protein